jgi:hypothetical protein
MTSQCEFELYYEGYFNSELSPAEELNLQEHLLTCTICQKNIDAYYSIYTRLKKYQRPLASANITDAYYQQVDLSFGRESSWQKVIVFVNRITSRRSPFYIVAQLATLILVGILVGWLVFSPADPRVLIQNSDPYQTSRPISKIDIDYVYYYLLAAEMILLEANNSLDQPDFYLDRELAQKLLIKTFRVHEISLRLNNIRMLTFLSQMELLLHEASNLSNGEIKESIDTIRMVIEEAGLLHEVKNLQRIMQDTQDQYGA